jgi:speckle-type POZ protein
LLDKAGSPVPSIGTGKSMDSYTGSFVGGYVLFAMRDDIKANCVVDNYFVVLCSMDINYYSASSLLPRWAPPASSMENEQPDLGHNLAMMWGKQELTDVSFDVGGESLSAHRVVLAAQSAVFRAELYGPMAESKMTSITIKDMEASTFRSMLHYIYHGSLPDAAKTVVSSTMAEYQRLLVAADRYGVEGLKKICEDTLCADDLTVDSVLSLLELAEDHLCSKLKARCFDLLTEGDNFKVVATSADYLHLMQSFPNLLVEFRDRFNIPHEKPTMMEPGSHKKARLC